MSAFYIVLDSVYTALLAFSATVFNSLIIIVYFREKTLHTVNNIFLVQLALVDLMKSTLILPMKAYYQLTPSSKLNGAYCPVSGFIMTVTTVLSPFLLAAVAVVRYHKIVKWRTFDDVFSKRRIWIYNGMMLTTALIFGLLPILGIGSYSFSHFHGICFVIFSRKNIIFRTLLCVFIMGCCFPVVTYCYGCIFFMLRRQHKILARRLGSEQTSVQLTRITHAKQVDVNSHKEGAEQASPLPDQTLGREGTIIQAPKAALRFPSLGSVPQTHGVIKPNGIEERRASVLPNRSEIQVTKAMFTVVVVFTILWLPAFVANVLILSGVKSIPDWYLFMVVTLINTKVIANPLINGLWNHSFRFALKRLLKLSQ
ncbi:cholecystokinin receptor-like [Rhopilema esculentum]|uniref:cholecystokinin receptor-like n=1 Tax=Rhopilema esculentum TaxID=499914 RepID=UPI0031D4748A|eukprot:gene16713-8163_t